MTTNIHGLARYLWNETIRHDGATANIYGFSPADGYMVGGVAETVIHTWDEHAALDQIEHYILNNADQLVHPEHYVGTWVAHECGNKQALYIDISERYATEAEALEVAIERHELAVYNLTTHETIRVGSGYDIAHADPSENEE